MNVNAKKNKKQVKVQDSSINVLSMEEMKSRIAAVEKDMKSYTWRELETNGKFTKNDKLSFISDDMLIVGCDIGSEIHYIRAIDTRGRELSKEIYSFGNNEGGFQNARDWMVSQRNRGVCWKKCWIKRWYLRRQRSCEVVRKSDTCSGRTIDRSGKCVAPEVHGNTACRKYH